jgi:hypothetical protein
MEANRAKEAAVMEEEQMRLWAETILEVSRENYFTQDQLMTRNIVQINEIDLIPEVENNLNIQATEFNVVAIKIFRNKNDKHAKVIQEEVEDLVYGSYLGPLFGVNEKGKTTVNCRFCFKSYEMEYGLKKHLSACKEKLRLEIRENEID